MRFEKVLVTGAGGMLGRAVVDELAGRCRVSGLDLRRGDRAIDWHVADMTNPGQVAEAMRGHDAVVHVAAIPNVWSGSGDTIMRVNVVGTWNVLAAAEAAGVHRVVLCSSDSVIGYTVREGSMLPPSYLPVDEAHPTRATDPYGLSKVLNEAQGQAFALRGELEVVVLRPVFIAYPEMYGEIRIRAKDPNAYAGPMAGGPAAAGGGPCWHHVDPRDAARAFRLALEMKEVTYERFFVSARTTLYPEPTLDRLQSVLGLLPGVRKPEVYEQNAFAPLYDLGRARDLLGFEAEHDACAVVADAMA